MSRPDAGIPDTDTITPEDIAAMAYAYTSAGFTPERVLAGRDTPLSRAVAAAMERTHADDGGRP